MIPRVVHLTWKTKENIPEKWKPSLNAWKRMKGITVRFWTDRDLEEFVTSQWPSELPRYLAWPKQIQRVDHARYMILYTFGGIYCDLDIEPVVDMEPLLQLLENWPEHVCLAEMARPWGQWQRATNSFMVSCKGHPFWLHLLQNTKPTLFERALMQLSPHHMGVIFSMGPGRLNRALAKDTSQAIVLPNMFVHYTANNKPSSTLPPPAGSLVRIRQGCSWHQNNGGATLAAIDGNRPLVMLIMLIIALVVVVCFK